MIDDKFPKEAFDKVAEIGHTADLALHIRGKDLEDLLCNAARGMSALMSDAPPDSGATEILELSISAADAESLLVEWLSELAYLAESKGAVFSTFSVHAISETGLCATLSGRLSGPLRRAIKAVTYHHLAIRRTADGLETTVVFDV